MFYYFLFFLVLKSRCWKLSFDLLCCFILFTTSLPVCVNFSSILLLCVLDCSTIFPILWTKRKTLINFNFKSGIENNLARDLAWNLIGKLNYKIIAHTNEAKKNLISEDLVKSFRTPNFRGRTFIYVFGATKTWINLN